MGRHPGTPDAPGNAERRWRPGTRRDDLGRPAYRRGRAGCRGRVRARGRPGLPVHRRRRRGPRTRPARGRPPHRGADERRSLRSAGPVLGRDDGLRRVAGGRGAVPPGARRQLHHRADRPDHLQRHRLESRRQHDVPQRQRHRMRRRVPVRRRQRRDQQPPHPRAHRPARRGARRAHGRRGGRDLGRPVERRGRPPVRTGWIASGQRAAPGPATDLVRVRRARPGHAVRDVRADRTSTTTRWPASRTQARCSRSTDSASAACPACRTAARYGRGPIAEP